MHNMCSDVIPSSQVDRHLDEEATISHFCEFAVLPLNLPYAQYGDICPVVLWTPGWAIFGWSEDGDVMYTWPSWHLHEGLFHHAHAFQ